MLQQTNKPSIAMPLLPQKKYKQFIQAVYPSTPTGDYNEGNITKLAFHAAYTLHEVPDIAKHLNKRASKYISQRKY